MSEDEEGEEEEEGYDHRFIGEDGGVEIQSPEPLIDDAGEGDR